MDFQKQLELELVSARLLGCLHVEQQQEELGALVELVAAVGCLLVEEQQVVDKSIALHHEQLLSLP